LIKSGSVRAGFDEYTIKCRRSSLSVLFSEYSNFGTSGGIGCAV